MRRGTNGSHKADYVSQGLFLAFRSNAFWPSLLFGVLFFWEFSPKQTAFKWPLLEGFFLGRFSDLRWWSVLFFCKARGRLLFHKKAPWDFLTVHKSPRGSSVSTLSVKKKRTNQRADGPALSSLSRRLFSCHFMVLDHQHKVEKSERFPFNLFYMPQILHNMTVISVDHYLELLFIYSYQVIYFVFFKCQLNIIWATLCSGKVEIMQLVHVFHLH